MHDRRENGTVPLALRVFTAEVCYAFYEGSLRRIMPGDVPLDRLFQ